MDGFICCLCKKHTYRRGENRQYGNNPYPLKPKGECCDECNSKKVVPTRIYMAKKRHDVSLVNQDYSQQIRSNSVQDDEVGDTIKRDKVHSLPISSSADALLVNSEHHSNGDGAEDSTPRSSLNNEVKG